MRTPAWRPLVSVPTYRRHTVRLAQRLCQIAYQLGGQAGARLATLLGMPVSDTTLVRLLQASRLTTLPTPKVLGVDDWSLKKGQTYGTILVDMEKHKPIDLLPDRESETLTQWLQDHPGVEIICRDRASGYTEGATNGAPQALQIADRWHLLKNLGDALQRMLDKKNVQMREAAQQLARQQQAEKYEQQPTYQEVVGPHVLLSSATARRAQIFREVKQLLVEGYSSRKIAKRLKIGRNTVNRYRHMDRYREKSRPKKQQSTVLPYRNYLAKRWAEGERDRKQLWRELQQRGFAGTCGCIYRFFQNIPKDAEVLPIPELEVKNWTPRKVQFLLSKKEEALSEEEKRFLKVFSDYCPEASTARGLALDFHDIFANREAHRLPTWIEQAKASSIAALKRFAVGLESDYAAVVAAATYEWSSGQVEGQVNRLKMLKPQMYGRAGFDLLRKRVVNYQDSG
ncbi:MAG: ISL3 family transposase [Bacteroidota bacterium]